MTVATYDQIVALHASGLALKKIARRTGVSVSAVRKLVRPDDPIHEGPTDTADCRQRTSRPNFDSSGYHDYYAPTPGEIALACQDIRAEWSDVESASRKAFNPDEPQPWTPPTWSGKRLGIA